MDPRRNIYMYQVSFKSL